VEYQCVRNQLPEGAVYVRRKVFMEEQGFKKEFDEIDSHALHGVISEKGAPLGTFRLFPDSREGHKGVFIIGRVCVMKTARGKHIGEALLAHAEEEAIREGGKELRLNAQVRAEDFYRKSGYVAYGPVKDQEGVPHQWMRKRLGAERR
jgi:predicted GNAT family N-acyltransferase